MEWIEIPNEKISITVDSYCQIDLCPFCAVKICWNTY